MNTLKFRVLIDTTEETDVFRDILVNSSDSFESFYNSIMLAFNFAGDQLGSFYLSNENWDKGHEITLMDMGMGSGDSAPSIMRDTTIDVHVGKIGQKLILVYDFMKMWCFLIELIEVEEGTVDGPEIVLSVGEAPHEDSKEADFSAEMFADSASLDLGNDIDDIFSDFDGEDFEDIDNLGDEI